MTFCLLKQGVYNEHMYRKDGASAYWTSWMEKATTDPAAARLVRKDHVRPAEELQDLDQDPQEQVNQAENPTYTAQLRKTRPMEDAWIREQGDAQTVSNNPYLNTNPLPNTLVAAP